MSFNLEDLKNLTPDQFEQLTARLLQAQGFRNFIPLGASGDEGIDIRAEWLEELPTGNIRTTIWAVQCKRYSNPISPKEVRQILDAVMEPPLDFFLVPPDFFLLVTSAKLTNQAKRVIERANRERGKYHGCRFLVWEGADIVTKLDSHPEIVSLFTRVEPKFAHAEAKEAERLDKVTLTVIFDQVDEKALLTFIYDEQGQSPTSLMAKTAITQTEFEDLKKQCQILAANIIQPSFSTENETFLKSVGQHISELIPSNIQRTLWNGQTRYMRLASNLHVVPYELAYEPRAEKFLGSLYKIGRVQLSEFQTAGLPRWPGLSMLVVGDVKSTGTEDIYIPELPLSKKETETISSILAKKGFNVHVLTGSEATFMNLRHLFNQEDFQIIHFATHGISQAGELSGLVLADRIVRYDDLLPSNLPSSLIVLSACSTGNVLNEASNQFIGHGAIGLIGCIGPVTDDAAAILAIKFYEELAKGETLGTALQHARETQRTQRPTDFSWASFVLFGDPTITVV